MFLQLRAQDDKVSRQPLSRVAAFVSASGGSLSTQAQAASFLKLTRLLVMPSFEATVAEIRDIPTGGCTVILRPNELETTTDLKSVLIEPKFATAGGTIHKDHIELYCAERPAIHVGQVLMVRTLDPHGE